MRVILDIKTDKVLNKNSEVSSPLDRLLGFQTLLC